MYDRFNRKINYLRISVTDKCNQRCIYCMPSQWVSTVAQSDLLSFEEIVQITETAVSLGIDKVRLTGGEPLIRQNIVSLVRMLNNVSGIKDLSLTTNGTLLEKYARKLFDAGIKRINISLDTLDPERYSQITGGDLGNVIAGISSAKKVGMDPIKLNCVIENSVEEPDAQSVARFASENGFEARFIPRMDLCGGKFRTFEGGSGGNCSICNRLRLSCDGYFQPCLFNDIKFSVRELGAKEAILRAIEFKPEFGESNSQKSFCAIGG